MESSIGQKKSEQRRECKTRSRNVEFPIRRRSFHLQKAYDDAYFKSPYGTHRDPVPEIGMLKDFIKGWMQDFVNRGSGVIPAQKGGEVNWLASLFQNLCSPQRACLPHELTAMIKQPPQHPWDFIPACALECWASWQPVSKDGKKQTADPAPTSLAAPAAGANQAALYSAQMASMYGAAYAQQVSAAQRGAPY